jgi:hypothetical protein
MRIMVLEQGSWKEPKDANVSSARNKSRLTKRHKKAVLPGGRRTAIKEDGQRGRQPIFQREPAYTGGMLACCSNPSARGEQ